MHVENFRTQFTGMLAPRRFAAGVFATLVLLSAACSGDSASRISAPPRVSNANAGSSLSLGAASSFAALSAAPNGGGAVTCTNTPPPTTITGDVGSSGGPASVVNTGCTINGAIVAPVSAQVLADFNNAYDGLAGQPCDQFLTGTLAGVTLAPGTYCFAAAATLTGTLTLSGPADATWLFKIGTSGTGALTGTDFKVVMSGGADPCNVTWWVAEAATMTTSNFIGTILAGAGITVTSGSVGTFNGRALAKAAVTITGGSLTGCTGGSLGGGTAKAKCNQGVGNGPEGCDPGNSNNHNPSNDERGGTPGNPGRKGGH
jgi:Ice-binding-like